MATPVRASRVVRLLPLALALAAGLLAATPARAQWTRAVAVTSNNLYSVFSTGDTVVAGADSVVWVSINAGATWSASAPVGTPPAVMDAVWFGNGRLWAGTSGQGVYTSDDFGATWQPGSDGLAGGLLDSHLWLLSFAARGDSLYAGTGGAGVFVRPLLAPGPWQPTGGELVANQSGSVEDLAVNGNRLLAVGGANGTVHRNEGGAPWTEMFLNNTGLFPGLEVTAVEWTGSAWLVGTDHGMYRSADGTGAWEFCGLNFSGIVETLIAVGDSRAFVCVNRTGGGVFRWTRDNGVRWNVLETVAAWPSALALQGQRLWASRFDGLWYRDVSTLDVPPPVPSRGAFAVRGEHPVRGGEASFAFGLPAAGAARLELFDAGGRRVRALDRDLPAGNHELKVDVRGLPPGVYHARLTAGERTETLRLVRLD
jgi:photosystem II stability/assembly factor-like uncharacterized protein